MAKKTEIDSYSKLYYWIDCMLHKHTGKQRAGLQRLRDFLKSREDAGWPWEQVAEWAIYSTSTTSDTFDPFEGTSDKPIYKFGMRKQKRYIISEKVWRTYYHTQSYCYECRHPTLKHSQEILLENK